MIRRSVRFGIRLGLLAGIAFALFKLIQGRRSASELGRPLGEWAPAPTPSPNLPKPPPEPELVQPVILEEIVAKKGLAGRAAPAEEADAPPPTIASVGESVIKKATPVKKAAKRAAAKKAAAPVKKAAKKAAAPVKKAVAPVKKASRSQSEAMKSTAAPKKAAPVKKAAKKQR